MTSGGIGPVSSGSNLLDLLSEPGETSGPPLQLVPGQEISFDYTNWRGEASRRRALPVRLWFGATKWHPEPQWLMSARDADRGEMRDFAMGDMRNVRCGT